MKKVLTRNSVKIGLSGTGKNAVIEELVDMIAAQDDRLNRDDLLKAVFDREQQMSTGMKNGIAIPHGKTDIVNKLYAAVGVSKDGIDFECMDKCPAHIFVMTISPASHTGPHLQFLAEVSGLLTREDLRTGILNAETEDQLLSIFLEGKA